MKVSKIASSLGIVGCFCSAAISASAIMPAGSDEHRNFYKAQEWIWKQDRAAAPKSPVAISVSASVTQVSHAAGALACTPPMHPPRIQTDAQNLSTLACTPPMHPPRVQADMQNLSTLACTPPMHPPRVQADMQNLSTLACTPPMHPPRVQADMQNLSTLACTPPMHPPRTQQIA